MKKFLLSLVIACASFVSIAQQVETIESDRKNSEKTAQEILIPKGIIATPVKNQQQTGTCWAFSTTSLLESQSIKNNIGAFDLSEMFTVRNIYIEKAKNYILRQGKAQFGEGALGHDVIRSVSLYGAMPENIYSGLSGDYTSFNHSVMVKDLKSYLDTLLNHLPVQSGWLNGYITMMDKTMGTPPASFVYKGRSYTPQSFAKEVLRFNANDYVNLTSFTHHPFNQSFILEVPDNFSNGTYYNLPLNEMTEAVKSALNNGYTVMWDADVSNFGFQPGTGFARYQPSSQAGDTVIRKNSNFELNYDEKERQRLFENLTTQDDHLMHITGMEKGTDGKMYFIVKNSWGDNGPFKGYIKVSEAYFAMNTISIIVPRAGLPKSLLEKIK